MDPEAAASNKTKKPIERISSVDLENKPQDFFYKNKNIAKMILSYLDTKSLHLMSRASKYLFFEIHQKENKYFRSQFYRLLGDSILVIPRDQDHNNYKFLSALVYSLKFELKSVWVSLIKASLHNKYDKCLLDKENTKIILPPGEYESIRLHFGETYLVREKKIFFFFIFLYFYSKRLV